MKDDKDSHVDVTSILTPPKARIFVYQIFYSEETKRALDSGFIPLDNTENRRPDWFEFWVIRNFLKSNRLDDNSWYGFLSPKFGMKTGLRSDFVLKALDRLGPDFEVALFSSFIDHLACFQNPFIQMDRIYPGLLRLSQDFFDMRGINVNLESLVSCLSNSVYSNYVVAKPIFWKRWLAIADPFFDFVENRGGKNALLYERCLPYGNMQVPAKVFIQERFSSVVLSQLSYRTFVPAQMRGFSRFEMPQRRFFMTCDFLKEQYCNKSDIRYLEMFKLLRRDMAPIYGI